MRLRFISLFLLALLASCTTQPPQQKRPSMPTPQLGITVPAAPDQLQVALAKLPSNSDKRQTYVLGWANQYLKQSRVDDADTLLDTLNPAQLPNKKRLRWTLLTVEIHLARHQPDKALALLDNTGLDIPELIKQAPTDTRSRLSLLRADALLLQGKPSKSLAKRIAVNPHLNDTSRAYNDKMIWTILMHLPANQLRKGVASAKGQALGWFKLAAIYRDPMASLSVQAKQVHQWQQQWPDHPAAQQLPAAIQVLLKTSSKRSGRIAVLLPLNGGLAKAAHAIRDGLLTGYYHDLSRHHDTPELAFIDTSQGNIRQLYQQAVNKGASLVLGPLDKQHVRALLEQKTFPVPVLTWNAIQSGDARLPDNFYEYGLVPEDQAEQIAKEAWREGNRKAGMLYPNTDWGKRLASAFVKDWQALGGTMLSSQSYKNQGSQAVPALLLTNESKARERDIRRYTPLTVKFTERPRKDMDFIFLVANAGQGRQIKPLLNFHFASSIPVFALSYIYQGKTQPSKDRDLDNIRFLDIPWILHQQSPLHKKVDAIWPNKHGIYQSLFAMGLDSYRLIDHLPLLIAAPGMSLPGQTGRLRLGKDHHIHRTLDWAVFHHGLADPLPVVATGFGLEP